MFSYKLGLHFEGDADPSIIDLANGGEINTRDGETNIPFVSHSIGEANINCQDVITAAARSLVGTEVTSVNPRKGETDEGGKIIKVDLIRVSEETIETF